MILLWNIKMDIKETLELQLWIESGCDAVTSLQHTVSSAVGALPTFELFRFCSQANYKSRLLILSFIYVFIFLNVMIQTFSLFF